jgi:predicted RND superfamily exporter protein
MKAFIRALLRRRALVLILLVATLGVASWSALRIQIRFQFRDFYDYPGNPQMPLFSRYGHEFGDPAGFVVVLVEADDVFRPDLLRWLEAVTREIEPDPIFSHVRSLVNAKATYAQGDEVVTGALMPSLPSTAEEVARVRKAALGSTLLVRRLVSTDSQATVVLAEMRTPANLSRIDEQRDAIAAVERVLQRHPIPAGARLHVTGAPVAEVESTRTITRDLLVFTPVAVGLIALALFFIFRSLQGVLLPLSAVTVAMVWTAGIFACLHHPVDIIGSTMPAALLVYGVVDSIYVLTRVLQKLEEGRSREDAIVEAQTELALPCFLTSFTTALGFFSFQTATLPTVAKYGLTVGIGVLFSWITTVTVLPVLLTVLPLPRVPRAGLRSSPWLAQRIRGSWRAVRGRVPWVLAGALAVLVGGGWYAHRQHLNSIYVGNLPRGPVLDSIRVLERKLSGVDRTVVFFEGEPGTMKRPEVLRAIAAVDRFAETKPYVNSSVSLSDLVAEANQAFHDGDPAERRIPDSRALVAQYLALIDPGDRSDFVDASYARTHLRILSDDPGSETFRQLRVELEQVIAREFRDLPGITVTLTGNSMVAYPALDKIVVEILIGFIVAFAIIVTFILILFRSARIALISIVPNLIPVVFGFAYLRLFHVSLRMDTSLFLSVSIGGLFNTTIHIAARIRQLAARGAQDPDAIVEDALATVGPPSLFTAAMLSLGFASFTLSAFPGLRVFGVLAVVTLLGGFFSDMIVSAASMRAFFGWKRALRPAPSGEAPPNRKEATG